MLWQVLVQFLFRLAFGLSFAMAITPARLVSAGFYRVHLWVVLGLNTFASAIAFLLPQEFEQATLIGSGSAAVAILSYVGAVVWLYEKRGPGVCCLWGIASANAALGCYLDWTMNITADAELSLLTIASVSIIDFLSSGLVIGTTFTAMLLGHWYLNTPTMKLDPLKKLIRWMAGATLLRILVCGVGLALMLSQLPDVTFFSRAVISLRWLAGLLGLLVLAYMTWQTIKIPNTQSATGILYVGVIFVFLGELASRLLSAQLRFPL